MRYLFYIILAMSLTGCANVAASITGTFVGNVMSDKYIKSTEQK